MTSTPVTASTSTYYTRAAAAGTSAGTDVKNSFSDVLKSQKSDGQTDKPDMSRPRTEDKTDLKRPGTDKPKEAPVQKTESKKPVEETRQSDEPEKLPDEVMEEAAAQMLAQTAKELNMTEEELLALLNELGMTPMDLLQTDSLQTVVLQAFGETDSVNFMTNEQMFHTFQNLKATLDEVVSEVAEATGLDKSQISELFDELMKQQKNPETVSDAVTVEEEKIPTEQVTEQRKTEGTEPVEEPEEVDETKEAEGADELMTARSMASDTGNADAQDFTGRQSESQNPFVQNLAAKVVQPEVTQEVRMTPVFDADTEMILKQITDYMKSHVTEGISELEMQLHPESLGSLHVKLTAKEGMVTAQFTAQNDAVKMALEGQMIQLKETFKEQGITVEAIEVAVESHRFDQNLSQNSGQSNGDDRQPGRRKTRRINLNLPAEEEDFSEEEKLAAEMLTASGNTVDYTA